MTSFSASTRLKKIFLDGNAGKRLKLPIDFTALEQLAKLKLSKEAFDYIYTGAGTNQGKINNTQAFKNYQIVPRMAHGLEKVDLSTKLLGLDIPLPILFAPIGVLELAHPKADLELANAARQLELPMIISNQASYPMEEIADHLRDSDHWFQLYFSKNYELVENFVHRAEKSGAKAIVLTLDTTTIGWRSMDLQNGFLPFARGMGIAQYTSDPVFQKLMQEANIDNNLISLNLPLIWNAFKMFQNYPGSFLKNLKTKEPLKAVKTFIDLFSKPDLNWKDIGFLRNITKLPILLKGILRTEDALKAIDCGADGIIVSNHGARQVDQVIGSLDALVEIKKLVPKDYPLLFDSGIRTGTDIFISLALGAKAVLLGRPYVYSLAIGGASSVEEYVQNLAAELEICMLLTGTESFKNIDPKVISRK